MLDEIVSLVLQPLPHTHLSRVQPLPIMAVDWLRGGGPGVRVQRATSESRKRQEVALYIFSYVHYNNHTGTAVLRRGLVCELSQQALGQTKYLYMYMYILYMYMYM